MATIPTWLKQAKKVYRVKKSFRKVAKAKGKRFTAQGRRVAVEYNIQYIRKFDGEKYHLFDFVGAKTRAESIVNDVREDGFAARFVSVKGKYAIYIKKRK